MKTLVKTLCILFLGISYSQTYAQNENNPSKQKQSEEKAWMEYMTPGNYHQMLAKADGEWQEQITIWMTPEAVPTKSMATATNKMIMDGRYQYSTHKGSFNGRPFEGLSIMGYDNAKKVFENSWIDNMGTGIMITRGPWNEANKSIELKGSYVDPSSGKEMSVREIMKWVDDNTQTMEMYMVTPEGKEMKTMEIMLTRKTRI